MNPAYIPFEEVSSVLSSCEHCKQLLKSIKTVDRAAIARIEDSAAKLKAASSRFIGIYRTPTPAEIKLVDQIQVAVAKAYKISVSDLVTGSRERQFLVPRQIAIYLCKSLTSLSLPQMSVYFDNMHHTTLIHSIKKIKAERETNQGLDLAIRKLIDELQLEGDE